MVRSRPSDGRDPEDRATTPIASDHRRHPVLRPALCERKPRQSSCSFYGWEGRASFPNSRRARRNRRAPGASAGGAFGLDKRSRLERTNAPPAVGDRSIAGCSAVNPRHCRITSARTSAPICVICGFLRWVGALRVCDVGGWVALRPKSVSLCLCGFPV